jgi:two-component system response regulator RegA
VKSARETVEKVRGEQTLPSLLLVDDDRVLCTVMARALQRRGYDVIVAHDYQSALDAAAGRPLNFAVVDLKFPGGSGLSLIKDLMDLNRCARVVVLTGYGSIATAIAAIKSGAHYYLTKPANADDVVAALRGDGEPASAAPVGEKPLSVNRMEWEHINRVLGGNNGNVSATARVLGMHRRTLQRKLGKHPVRN